MLAGCAFLLGVIGSISSDGTARVSGRGGDDGDVFPSRAAGDGRLRSVSFLPSAGPRINGKPARAIDRGGPLLRVFVRFLLHRSHGTAVFRAPRQPGIRFRAPNAPHVFIDDAEFKRLWLSPDREYFLAFQADLPHYEDVVGTQFQVVAASGGKALLTNHPFANTAQLTRFPMSASD